MNVVVTLDHHFERTPDGVVWTQTQFAHSFWTRYLSVFDGVRVLARCRGVATASPGWVRADGPGVSLVALPHYRGPAQYLVAYHGVGRAARAAVRDNDAVVLRVSSTVGLRLGAHLRRVGRPYGVEVVADPYDVFAPGSVRHPLRPLLRWWFPHELRKCCAGAVAAAYVTARALQRRYPPSPNAFTTNYSSIELPESAFAAEPKRARREPGRTNLLLVGTLAQLYKAPDVLIDAVGRCVREGLDLGLVIVGDGKFRPALEAQAAALGIADRVLFRGQLTAGEPVRQELDRADLFVLPSHQEGLPRAAIEAMARGLPCVGSTVGGFPELLPAEDLVPPGDAAALARKLREVVTDPDRLDRMAARNLGAAREYREDVLRPRRTAFYEHLRAATTRWLQRRSEGAPVPCAASSAT